MVVTDSKQLLDCADKKYDPNPLLTTLREAAAYDKVAFAGLACHVQALRKLQYAAHTYLDMFADYAGAAHKLTRNIRLVVGIGDIGRFGRGKIDVLLQENGVSGEHEVARHIEERITADFVFTLLNGKEVRIPQTEVIKYPQPFCFLCNDFNGYASDLTVDRSEFQQFNTVMLRNQLAEDVFNPCVEKNLLQIRELPDEGRDFLEGMTEMLHGFTDYDLYGYEYYLNNGEFKIDESMGAMFGNQENRRLRGLPENMLMELLKKYPMYGFCTKKRRELGYTNPDYF
jgi:coenzyme F420-reducing hydrogenase beta subunit